MTVVAADEFGTVVDGTPGEVLKFLPGITMDYSAGEARTISMNGVPASNVRSPSADSISRAPRARHWPRDQPRPVSVNSIARIEKLDSPRRVDGLRARWLGEHGSRSAFERSRPAYNFGGFIMMKDGDRHFNKTAARSTNPAQGHARLNFSASCR